MKTTETFKKITDREFLQIFPEMQETIPEKIEELLNIKQNIISVIQKKLKIIKEKSAKENQWFWREWIKVFEGEELLKVEKEIKRFEYLSFISSGKTPKNSITDEMIKQAQAVPIENMISTQVKKSGKNFMCKCPFHEDKRPSFYIYTQTNSFYCFSCGKGGDTITFTKEFYNLSFQEAIRFILKN